ncbi:MAG: hypothetical protein WBH03_18960, partial [Cyclobacteriaceae bacterium]
MSYQEPVLDSFDIQANISPGLNLPYQLFIGLAGSAEELKNALKYLAPKVTSMQEAYEYHKERKSLSAKANLFGVRSFMLMGENNATWFNIAFGRKFLYDMGYENAVFQNSSFHTGMYERSPHLGDSRNPDDKGHRKNWEFGTPESEVDLFIIVAAVNKESLIIELNLIEDKFRSLIICKNFGQRLPNDTEHFGFQDGISQPKIRGYVYNDGESYLSPRKMAVDTGGPEYASPGAPLIWPGEFIFGYPNQDPNNFRKPASSPVLSEQDEKILKNGSFLVVRKLVQDVAAFYDTTDAMSAQLQTKEGFEDYTPDYLRAKLIGRFKNGSPLVRNDKTDVENSPHSVNHFNFNESTPAVRLTNGDVVEGCEGDFLGQKCPMFAHIRKVNPRDLSTDQGSSTNTLKFKVMRRGVPFGPLYDFNDRNNPVNNEKRGLFFLCYQTSIENQFELLQNRWVNSPVNPEENKGFDMVLGN